MIRLSYPKYAVLVFINQGDIDQFKQDWLKKRRKWGENHFFTDVDNVDTLARMQPGAVYFVTKKDLMRGYHYQCVEGIAEFLTKQVDS